LEIEHEKNGFPEQSRHAIDSDGYLALAELRLSTRYDDASDAIKNQIIHEQAYGQFAVLRYAAISTFVLSSLSLFALWSSVSHDVLLTWYAITNIISLSRHIVANLFTRIKPTGALIKYWLHLVLFGTVAIALSWCALVWITWPIHDTKAISFTVFILATVAFGSFAGLGFYVQAYWGAAGPLFIALAVMFAHLASDSIPLATGMLSVILFIGVGMLSSSVNVTRIWHNIMVLLHEHQTLASEHREKSAVLSTTLRSIGDGVFTIDANRIITYINPAAEQLTGQSLQNIVGKTLSTTLALKDENVPDRIVNLDFLCQQVRESVQVPGDLTMNNLHGKTISVEVTISPLHIADDLIDGYVITLHDVTSLRLLTRDLSRQALHDPLTGLLNRRGFESRVREAMDRKHTSNIDHCLCYIDLDHFKSINDTYGHKAGDETLQNVVSIAQKCIRDSDSFGRLGGDEFAILLYGCNLEKAQKIVSDICAAVAQHQFAYEHAKFSAGVSIGLVPMLTNDTVDSLNHAADSACYQAKANGRGQVHTGLRAP
jgi:diguanylate cyclase (GGDEF)-like protein/PAS domain S-box-containing protein